MANGVKDPQAKKTEIPATQEQVRAWIRKDLNAAHFLLGMVLQDHPDIVTELADMIYNKAMSAPGSRIDENPNQLDFTKEQ